MATIASMVEVLLAFSTKVLVRHVRYLFGTGHFTQPLEFLRLSPDNNHARYTLAELLKH